MLDHLSINQKFGYFKSTKINDRSLSCVHLYKVSTSQLMIKTGLSLLELLSNLYPNTHKGTHGKFYEGHAYVYIYFVIPPGSKKHCSHKTPINKPVAPIVHSPH